MGVVGLTKARDGLLAADQDGLHSSAMCSEIVRAFHRIATFDWCALMTTDPATLLPSTGVVEGFPPSACAPFWENELVDPDFNKFSDLARSVDPVVTLHETVDGDLSRSPRYTKLYAPLEAADEMRVAFSAGGSCLAIGAFVRAGHRGPFTPEEVADARELVPVATRVLRRSQGRGSDVAPFAGPAVILLDGEGNISSMTEGSAALLEDLRIQVDGDFPGIVKVAAAKARWSRTSSTLTTQVRGRSGSWLRLDVAPMQGDAETVAVTIAPVRPDDLALILLDSYGLTERETEIVLRLCRGLATKEIAAELMISTHTVRDHVKAVFEKAGVSSRGELVAELFASHLLDGLHRSTTHVADVS